MRAFKILLTLSLLSAIGHSACANVQAGDIAGLDISAQEEAPIGEQDERNDIVVTARRHGEAKVAAEMEFDEAEIAAQGVGSIQDLLARLAPYIGNGGDSPVVLINGRPAGFDRSILAYPTEALSRLAVLKPEASTLYGAALGKRVVNLVLKRKFSSLMADVGINWAIRGGQHGNTFSIGRTAISGDTRWNAQVRLTRDSALLKSARTIPRLSGAVDGVGYISGLGGGEIDRALSDVAGEVVTVAAIPPRARSGMPTIDDFAATANGTYAADPNAFDTLQPSRRTMAIDAGVTRPLGEFSITLDMSASSSRVQGLRGIPMVSIVIPTHSPWSVFKEDVLLSRPFAGTRALRNIRDIKSLGASLTLTGAVDGWQTSLALSYRRNWTKNALESGINAAQVQQLIDDGNTLFNPYGAWDKSLLLATRNKANGDEVSARLNVQKKIADLPAGALAWSFIADASRAGTNSWHSGSISAAATLTNVTFNQVNARMSLTVPLLRRGRSEVDQLGDLSADMWISGQTIARAGVQTSFGGGLNWSPIQAIQLGAAFEYVGIVPSFDQLDAPLVTTVARIFDYTHQEVAEPIWITGGNPDLQHGNRQTLTLSALAQPLGDQRLMLNLNYRQTIAKGGGMGFPELSPAIEAAFPDRVTRDSFGQLIAVDARAINISKDMDANLLSGIALRFAGGKRDPLQFNISLNHNWRLTSEMLIRPGVPVVDRLGGGTGASRHLLNLQLSIGKRGIGASINARWGSPARIDLGVANGILRIKPPATLDFSAFVDPDRIFSRLDGYNLSKNLNISISITNLLDSYNRVTLGDGSTPAGFSHDEIDPLGRAVRLTVRKRF